MTRAWGTKECEEVRLERLVGATWCWVLKAKLRALF